MAEQPADWIEQEVERILMEREQDRRATTFFRDFVPEGEEYAHPGQGTAGQGADYVPEGYTAVTWVARQHKEQRQANLEALEAEYAAVEELDLQAKANAAAAAPAKRLGRPPKGHGAAKAAA